jgi:hypothetical protein
VFDVDVLVQLKDVDELVARLDEENDQVACKEEV